MASKRLMTSITSRSMSSSSTAATASKYVSPISSLGSLSHKVSSFDQRLLVLSGRYRKLVDVPANVSRDTMERARNYFRIRLNMSIGALAVVGCLIFVISGKNAVHRGENINKQNFEWHRKYNETHGDVNFNSHQ